MLSLTVIIQFLHTYGPTSYIEICLVSKMLLEGMFLLLDTYMLITFIKMIFYFKKRKEEQMREDLGISKFQGGDLEDYIELGESPLSRFHRLVLCFIVIIACLVFENEICNFVLTILSFVAEYLGSNASPDFIDSIETFRSVQRRIVLPIIEFLTASSMLYLFYS